MQHQRIGIVPPPRAQSAGNGRRDAAAHGTGRGHLHQHDHREHQRHARQRIGAQLADKVGLDKPNARLRQHHQHIGRSQSQQRGRNGRLQQHAGARVQGVGHVVTAAAARGLRGTMMRTVTSCSTSGTYSSWPASCMGSAASRSMDSSTSACSAITRSTPSVSFSASWLPSSGAALRRVCRGRCR
jgi:hypothetical protein